MSDATDVTITVRGENLVRIAPERATIHVSIRTEAAERAAAVEQALSLADPVRASVQEREHSGSIVEWSSKRLAVRAERPWSNDGKRLALIYYASVDFTVTFSEASELSLWVSDVSAWDGIEIGSVYWHLTDATRTRVEREVASSAVGVAVARAEAYAGALGLTTVIPVEIADVGLIGSAGAAPQLHKARSAGVMLASVAESAPAMEYEPADIVVSATVEGRFLAR